MKHLFILKETNEKPMYKDFGLPGHESSTNQATQAFQHFVLPGQAETLTTRSPTFHLFGIAALRTETGLESYVIGGTSQSHVIHTLSPD